MDKDTETSLFKIPFLASLTPKEQERLRPSFSFHHFADGETIFQRDEKSTDVYFILKGATKSVNYTSTGQLVYFRLRHRGDFFGYYSGISGLPRTANMIAIGTTHLARLSAEKFMDMVVHHPKMSREMMKILITIIRSDTNRITYRAGLSAEQRVCADLLSLTTEHNKIEKPCNQSEWAAQLDMSRETLARILSKMEQNAILHKKDRTLYILDSAALHKMLED